MRRARERDFALRSQLTFNRVGGSAELDCKLAQRLPHEQIGGVPEFHVAQKGATARSGLRDYFSRMEHSVRQPVERLAAGRGHAHELADLYARAFIARDDIGLNHEAHVLAQSER